MTLPVSSLSATHGVASPQAVHGPSGSRRPQTAHADFDSVLGNELHAGKECEIQKPAPTGTPAGSIGDVLSNLILSGQQLTYGLGTEGIERAITEYRAAHDIADPTPLYLVDGKVVDPTQAAAAGRTYFGHGGVQP